MPRNKITGKVTSPYNLALEEINEERSVISHIQANYDDIYDLSKNCLDIRGTNNMRNNINMNTNKTITVKEGELPSNLATVSQVRKGKFGVDNSTDEATIDLVENPASTTEYSEGLIVTFKATKNSVNNMTVQINGLGYKELDKKQIGIGSFVKADIVKLLYNKDTDKFVSLNEKNQPINYYGLASDLNEFIVPVKQMITIDASTKNIPNSDLLQNNESKALLEVAKKDYKRNGALDGGWYLCEIQTLTVYLDTAHTYTRERLNEVWGSWKQLGIINNKINQMIMLAKAGTRNGDFKIRTDKNNQGNYYCDNYLQGQRYSGKYYSGFVFSNMKNYKNTPQIDTDLWFYLALSEYDNLLKDFTYVTYVSYIDKDKLTLKWLVRGKYAGGIPTKDTGWQQKIDNYPNVPWTNNTYIAWSPS